MCVDQNQDFPKALNVPSVPNGQAAPNRSDGRANCFDTNFECSLWLSSFSPFPTAVTLFFS